MELETELADEAAAKTLSRCTLSAAMSTSQSSAE